MGVTRRSHELQPIRVEEIPEFNYADFEMSDEENRRTSESVEVQTSRSRRNKERRAERKLRWSPDDLESDGLKVHRNMGARKWRRVENARSLLDWADREDICEDFSDIFPRTYTAFDRLFAEQENMKAWNEFIAKDEQEQLEILENAVSNANSEEKGWCVVGGKPTPSKNTPDARKHHPAYSGKACFERLDKKSKQILLSRKVNWALVDHLERELRSLFCSPGSPGDEEIVYVGHYPAASDRALAHTVAQYLWLTSQSVTIPGTLDRLTEFRNSRSFFIPPRICLIPYVESVLNKRIDFVPFSARGDDLLEDFGRLSMSSGQDSPKLDLTMSSDTASDEETHLD